MILSSRKAQDSESYLQMPELSLKNCWVKPMLKQNLVNKKFPTRSILISLSILMLTPLFHGSQALGQSESTTSLTHSETPPSPNVVSNIISQLVNRDIASEQTDLNNDSFFNPPNQGAPDRTADGGSRGPCPNYQDNPLTLLIPNNNSDDNPVTIAASTVSEYPVFLWYIPQFSQMKNLGFTLIEADTGEVVYETMIPVPEQAGIMRFQLPESQAPLKSGKWYQWYLSVSNSEAIEGGVNSACFASAYIGRRPLNSTQQQELINAATNLEKIWNFHVKEIIWYDALATLDQMRREHPEAEKLNRKWQALLGLIGLSQLSEQPPI
jgi:hypothetical protein